MGQIPHRVRRNTITIFIGLLAALGTVGALPSWQLSNPTVHPETVVMPYADKDAYLIYAILLENTKSSSFVIQSETMSWSGATPENIGIKGDRGFRKVWGIALRDFARQYREPMLLTRDIPVAVPYALVSQQNIVAIFNSEGGWNTFYERYPLSGGHYSFSAVGFDPQKTHAIVTMNHSCGAFCGGGSPHFFQKEDDKWREVSVNAKVWVWAS